MDTFVYFYNDNLYFNLTNECSNNCIFCIRNLTKEQENLEQESLEQSNAEKSDGEQEQENPQQRILDYDLWLTRKPTAQEVIEILQGMDLQPYKEAVFCGFGEPLYALDTMLEIAKYLHTRGMKTRLNTNGQAFHICGAGVPQRLKDVIDCVSISLNAATAIHYQNTCNSKFGTDAFVAILEFALECKEQGIHTIFSVLDTLSPNDIKACNTIGEVFGIPLRIRKKL